MPGGPARLRPIEHDGRFFDALDPPRVDTGGNLVGGTEIDKDTVYADRFWGRRQPTGLRDAMIENIHSGAHTSGTIGSFVNPNGVDEIDKEKLSAYRVLARELGYDVEEFVFNPSAHTATATLRKRDES